MMIEKSLNYTKKAKLNNLKLKLKLKLKKNIQKQKQYALINHQVIRKIKYFSWKK